MIYAVHFPCSRWRQALATGNRLLLVSSVCIFGVLALAAADKPEDLLTQAQAAQLKGELGEALVLATKAINAEKKNAQAYYVRGRLYAEDGEHAKAVADFDQALTLEPRAAEIYQLRGLEQFKLGHFMQSCADFDKFLEYLPKKAPYHWQRGIALYYAGRYEDGRKQFELHQTVNSNDVENAVWHFLCVARSAGLARARAALIPIQQDSRVPMMNIYALFAGKAKPDDVLKAAKAAAPPAELNHQLFFAHLYTGLFYEASGNSKQARKYITEAADDYRVNDFMGEVARVHADLFKRGGR